MMSITRYALCFLMLPAAAWAHHSFAMFAMNTEQTISGVVKEFQWTNPHMWIQLDVAGESGNTVEWSIEGPSPAILVRRGYNSKTLKPGDSVSIVINPLKNGEPGGSLVRVIMADGKIVLGSPPPAANPAP